MTVGVGLHSQGVQASLLKNKSATIPMTRKEVLGALYIYIMCRGGGYKIGVTNLALACYGRAAVSMEGSLPHLVV